MLLMAPYMFHIGVAIGFTIYFNTIIHDTKAIGDIWLIFNEDPFSLLSSLFSIFINVVACNAGVIGLYNCVGGFLALPIGRVSDSIGRVPVAIFAMLIDLGAYYLATMAAHEAHQPHWHGSLYSSISPSVCGPACFAGYASGVDQCLRM
eukprot:SAG31_NODE_23655_length_499_cov_1.012500_1_plen_149_part_10